MRALRRAHSWPVDNVAVGVVTGSTTSSTGDADRPFRLASVTKPLTGWAVLVAVEEGVVGLDRPIEHVEVPDGATLRHLLSHSSGFTFDGDDIAVEVARRRIYSNTGIERAAAEVAAAADMPFADYLREAVLQPLGMSATMLDGSPAHSAVSTLDDMVLFVTEMLAPRLIAPETWSDATRNQFDDLAGIVPGVGRFDPCPWGLGVEIVGSKTPHWTGRANSPSTFGHFGAAGTMMWADPAATVGLVALTDRPYADWSAQDHWRDLSDAVLAEAVRP